MNPKFSEDIVPISDFKVNPGKLVKHVQELHRPIVVTSRGRGVAVFQDLHDFESNAEEREFMKAIVKGMVDLEEGRELSLSEVKKRLKLNQ
jgi:prevent-host-death family protein